MVLMVLADMLASEDYSAQGGSACRFCRDWEDGEFVGLWDCGIGGAGEMEDQLVGWCWLTYSKCKMRTKRLSWGCE